MQRILKTEVVNIQPWTGCIMKFLIIQSIKKEPKIITTHKTIGARKEY